MLGILTSVFLDMYSDMSLTFIWTYVLTWNPAQIQTFDLPNFMRHLFWLFWHLYTYMSIHVLVGQGGKAHSPGPCYENARDMGPREAHNKNKNKNNNNNSSSSSSSNSNSNADPTNIPQFTVFLGFPMCPFIIYNIFVILYPHFFFTIYLWSFTLMRAPGLLSGVSP